MNANAKKWVKALRSGKYRQGQGYLRLESEKFCCLGVACELAVKAKVIGKPKLDEYSRTYGYGGGNLTSLPTKVRRWLGLQDESGAYGEDGRCLATDNDNGHPFTEIAAIIESEPEGLFRA